MINISFTPLSEHHFPLLLKWLETSHVKLWWDHDVAWTPKLIKEKYCSYVKGYKLSNQNERPINAFIICVDDTPVGYIQIYNAYDFPRSKPLIGLPNKLAAFDIFIGDPDFINRGIGSKTMQQFLQEHYDSLYTHIFVDPDSKNIAAIKSYEKVGFVKISEQADTNEVWMILQR